MKTNASLKTIIQAVETVSKRDYNGNVVLRKTPEKMTKNVSRFTLKTLDADKPGSLITKQGVKQTKADWGVHQDVMNEILKIDPRPHIFVDTIYGRQYSKNSQQPVDTSSVKEPRKYRRRIQSKEHEEVDNVQTIEKPPVAVTKLVQAIKYILQNPEILND